MANPFLAASDSGTSDTNDLPELTDFAWDFDHDTFRRDTQGNIILVTENDALKVWIYKCLKTERARYPAYRHGEYNQEAPYGVELERFIGKRINDAATSEDVIRYIKEGLEVNPYIVRIISIKATSIKGDTLEISVELESIYGYLSQKYVI